MRVSKEDLEELDMEFVLEREGVTFRLGQGSSGLQANIKTCPSCHDDNWKCYFGIESGFGNCFKCDQKFNRATLIHALQGEESWARTFSEIEEMLKEQGWRPRHRVTAAVFENNVVLPLSTPMPDEDGSVLPYLATRGMTGEDCAYFHLRYCKLGWWMFRECEGGDRQMQDFKERVIIPVFDLDGKLTTFQGRDITGLSARKYLFPKSLPGTGKYILNAHNFMLSDSACMGEGFFDVAAIKMAFDDEPELRHVVPIGSFGKHLSYGDATGNDQLGRLHALKGRGLKHLTIMWDGEVNALEAALNAAKKITPIGINVRIALLPYKKDPNEVTPDVVTLAYRSARPWTPKLDMTWRLQNPYSTPLLRAKYKVA